MTAYAISNDPSAAPLREPRSTACGVAVVGAGPYGLAVSAALRGAGGVDIRTFGEPMSFWDGQMPKGMLLRSPREASHIGDPSGEWSLDRYEASIGVEAVRPVPLDRFVAYGRWVQENA